MKRIVICSLLLAGCLALAIYSAVYVTRVSKEVDAYIDAVEQSLDSGDQAALEARIGKLKEYWGIKEKTLMHYVRHSHIENISISVSRLPSLAKRGDFPELGAELGNIRWQMEHVRESEMVTLHNLL